MKQDIDRLMIERDIDAIVVEGPDGLGSANPHFNYFVGGQKLVGTVIKKRGEPTMLIHSPWERKQAEETGLVLISSDRWNRQEIAQQFPDRLMAAVEYRRQVFSDLGVTGRVGLYGTVSAGSFLALISALSQQLPDIQFLGEFEQDIISTARLTKDADEIDQMRDAGQKTCAVVQAVVDFIRSGQAKGDTLVNTSGTPMTIGDVRALVGRELAARGMEAPHDVIFAQGSDAGLPHAHGDDAAPLRLGQSIVFDIYPCQQGGGYYHDMTRTFAIGYAPPELQRIYDDVLGAIEHVLEELEVGAPTKAYQDETCRYFEARGHATIGSTYPIEEGYIHSLGHGIGLDVHEDLSFPTFQDRGDQIVPGAVFTIEPGLYYPSRGMGVRIEDTIYCKPDGTFENLTPFPKTLVIPID
ncbi:MAG: Xaa-Pro peptidase family protein [Chloroflexota bacterium]